MAKEIPYFKFSPTDWSTGDITLEDFELQGIFINVCSYYWAKDCELSMFNLKKRFRGYEQRIDELFESKIIKSNGENVVISFLNEQLASKELQKAVNAMNGRKGGRPKLGKTEEKPNGFNFENQNITNRENKDKERDRIKKLNNSLLSELKNSDFTEGSKELQYFKIARSFVEVFKSNKKFLGDDNVKHLNEAKYKSYTDPIRLIIENDGYKPEDLIEVGKYLKSKDSEFWKPNILSTSKLREKFEQLILKAKNPKDKPVAAEALPQFNTPSIDHSNRPLK